MQESQENTLSRLGMEQSKKSFSQEVWGFLRHNKKWWLLPILVMLFMLSILMVLSGSAAAPFIYTLF